MASSHAIMRAFDILKHGSVQPTDTFNHLIRKKIEENPNAHKQRVLLMLKKLGAWLDLIESEWKLVRISKRGQEGLYQLQKRNPDADHGHTSSQT